MCKICRVVQLTSVGTSLLEVVTNTVFIHEALRSAKMFVHYVECPDHVTFKCSVDLGNNEF